MADTSADFATALQNILNTGSSTDPMSQIVPFNPSMFSNPDLNSLIQNAYNALAPYYTQLIQQANGDYNVVIQQLQQQTDLTTRQAAENEAQTEKQANDNMTAALQTLGIQFPQETQQLLDSLNKRGIAVTQGPSGNLNTATEGESGYEMGQLTSDQALRKEAVTRSAQQQIASAQLSQQQTGEKAQLSQQQGTTNAQQSLRNTLQGYQQQREQTALTEGQTQASYQQQQQQLALQKQQLNQAAGGGSGNPYVGNNLTSNQLPSQLFNNIGTTTYNGVTYNVSNTGSGTRNVSLA